MVKSDAGTVNAYYQFQDYTASPLNVRRVTITPLGPSAEYGSAFLSQKPIIYAAATYTSLTNGYLLATNLITGYAYKVAFSDGFSEPTVTNYFGTNLSGTVGAVTNKTTFIEWSGGVAVRVYGQYFNSTITNTSTGSGGANVTATNLAVATTNGSTVTIDVSTNAVKSVVGSMNLITNGQSAGASIGGVNLSGTGIVTANSFVGDGSSLTGVGVSAAEVASIVTTNPPTDNMSSAMFYVNTKLANRQPIAGLFYGDNQIVNVGAGGGFNESVIAGLGTYLGRGGTKYASPTYVYSQGNGNYVSAVGTDALSHFGYWRMANGTSFTNTYASGAPDTSHLLISYMDSTGFGSAAVWTNGAGTWGLCRTIPAASGALRWNTTNISLGAVIPTLTVAVVSSGTNIVGAAGQYNTNSTKFVYDQYFVGNGDINTLMTNSFTSNQVFGLLSNYDLFFVSDISSSNTVYNGCLLLNNMITNNNLSVGVVLASGAPALDSPTTLASSRAIRIAYQLAARDFGFGLLDTYGALLPDTTNHLDPFFNNLVADRIHYDSKTSRALGALFMQESGLESSLKESLLYTNTSVANKANLVGDNVFSGNQTVSGYLLSTGSLAAVAFNHRNANANQASIYATGNAWLFADSTESNPWMVKSNASGTMSLNFTPYGGAAVFNFGNSSFMRYWGDGINITNIQATNIVAMQASVFPTNVIPLGSATVTNIGFVAWRGKFVLVATNISAGGWMWQTNGPSGAPVWGAFNPASQP